MLILGRITTEYFRKTQENMTLKSKDKQDTRHYQKGFRKQSSSITQQA